MSVTELTSIALDKQSFRDNYDPTGIQSGMQMPDFVDWAAGSRAAVSLPGLGSLTGHEVVLAEAIDLGLMHNGAIPFPIGRARHDRIYSARTATAEQLGACIVQTAEEYLVRRQDSSENRDFRDRTAPLSVVHLAGKLASSIAHQGASRRSGRPYHTHPDEVDSMLTEAWNTHIRSGEVDPRDLEVLQVVGCTHDAPEETMDPRGAYLAKPVIITPAVVREILSICDFGLDRARAAERTLVNLMRTVNLALPLGQQRMQYVSGYVERGANYPGLAGVYYCLPKYTDIQHNWKIEPDHIYPDDPKARQKVDRQRSYAEGQTRIRQALEDREDVSAREELIAHTVTQYSKKHVDGIRTRGYSFSEVARNAAIAAVWRAMAPVEMQDSMSA